MNTPDFLVHNQQDSVGVIVVETVKAGQQLSGWVMDNDTTISLDAINDIPLGHKIALDQINTDDTIVKYGHDIGKATRSITAGEHVHVHNVKTKRW